jgi:creatinine amidohydrolase
MFRAAAALFFVLVTASAPATEQAAPVSSRLPSVYVEELTWVEVRDAMKAGTTTVIIPSGGTEQSGPHLVLGKENFAIHYAAGEIARRLGNALVAPTLQYVPEGNLDPPSGHMRFPGSITLPEDAFVQVLVWAGRSFKATGFKDIVLIYNSGGNQAGTKKAADQLNKEWAGSGVRAHYVNDYYEAAAAAPGAQPYQSSFDLWLVSQGEKKEEIGNHAGIRDSSTLMAVEDTYFQRGKLVRWDKLAPQGGFEGSGVSGNPTRASVAYGKKGVELKVEAAVRQIKTLVAQK